MGGPLGHLNPVYGKTSRKLIDFMILSSTLTHLFAENTKFLDAVCDKLSKNKILLLMHFL